MNFNLSHFSSSGWSWIMGTGPMGRTARASQNIEPLRAAAQTSIWVSASSRSSLASPETLPWFIWLEKPNAACPIQVCSSSICPSGTWYFSSSTCHPTVQYICRHSGTEALPRAKLSILFDISLWASVFSHWWRCPWTGMYHFVFKTFQFGIEESFVSQSVCLFVRFDSCEL